MVFGDNVRARRAARALPRTPTQRGREKEKKRGEGMSPHTPPFHNDTTLNQQCCDSKHKRWEGGKKERRGNARGARTMQDAGPKTKTGHHSTPPPFNKTTKQTREGTPTRTGGDANIQWGASNTTALHSPYHPPSAMPPPFRNGPTHHHCEGGDAQRIPHHTNSTNTHSPPTHHTPGKEHRVM